jgi:hypothetical protein
MKRNIEARSCNQLQWKIVIIACSEGVLVALGIRMQFACALLPSPAPPYFSTLYTIKGMIFDEEVTCHKMCVLILPTILSKIFIILKRIEREILNIYDGFHVKYPLLVSRCNKT